ncbi:MULTISPECIES: ABC transporter substrate-binding protein [unclassified Rhizobium]|uniref:ABC transporter substrate-binding protein n=1 Tax=unclassified Rhizobium TaxID=2613769 RepID=UPI001FDA0FF3|nr:MULTISPECIES: ABC transporter substrate-binding protein [unclassified Rhizobium]MBP2460317.1 peptide/nickel transport system substrate-binding protein [Rhizobium sp. PvP014]MBP2527714.1 peptide/nickel transport system substrate-binding protein [Rhizobium sp. PvP099]
MTISRRHMLALLGSVAGATAIPARVFAAFSQSDYLAQIPTETPLPPIEERLPKTPRVLNLAERGLKPGRYGGSMRMLIGGQRDIRFMPINCYARLVGYNSDLKLEADILEAYEVENDRIFTFRLREGHKWSDGSPFTADDFRYVWDDVFHEKKLAKGGPPAGLMINGKPPRFEMIDARTVRYSWDDPNPDFLADQASPSPTRLMFPAAYMKQFHMRYQTKELLAQHIARERVDDWAALHQKMSRVVRPENPNLPTLDAWRNRTAPPAERFVFERNPYYYRVDENGLQLPYIDKVMLDVSSADLIAAKTGTGESDLQVTNLDFADYTFLKNAEQRYPLKVDLWKRTQGSRMALFPNLNCKDEGWRNLFRDVRFRRAMSLAINRGEINKAVFYGLATESSNSILPDSPLFKPEYQKAWAAFDPDQANRLLDEIGLAMDDSEGMRRLPDGRLAKIIIEITGESTFETDALELIGDQLLQVGIKIYPHVAQRELLRRRVKGGDAIMSVGGGLDNGVPTADMAPKELAPTSDDQLQWSIWGLHALSGGSDGKAPDLPEAKALLDLYSEWRKAEGFDQRTDVWHKMLALFTDQVFTIGIVNATLQPVVQSSKLQNVPSKALYGFDPTSYLGVYLPDAFWYDEETA